MITHNIYVASSWRNPYQPSVVKALREGGHFVYDFRNPCPGKAGFNWGVVSPDWPQWDPRQFVENLRTPHAVAGFKVDKDALDWCDVCLLVLPSGRSAHLEAGYAAGQGKRVIFMLSAEKFEPELMYGFADEFVFNIEELLTALESAEA